MQMDDQSGRLLRDLAISLASTAIFAGAAKLMTVVVIPPRFATAPTWLLATTTLTAAMVAFLIARRVTRGRPQAFVLISAFTHTRFLASLLQELSRSLDRHGIDMVVRLPPHDQSGRIRSRQLAALQKRQHGYIGAFMAVTEPVDDGGELSQLARQMRIPLVFLDVRPFAHPTIYPAGSAFVGCDPEEIGQKAADWMARELTGRGRDDPLVLALGGDSQHGRQNRFEARLLELLPKADVQMSRLGMFDRDLAQDIVAQRLRQADRRGEALDAIFCTNDEMALGAADAILEHGRGCEAHRDLAVVGVDGTAEARAAINTGASPLRATIVQDTQRLAEIGVDTMLRLRAGRQVRRETLVPVDVYPVA
ncbi:sugar ABC transporter substrate-binding protein [Allorhizocola rhizosphaerae]|uniref:sugar ABC transporter substrate-binding protein n=1 Tax=Allorhizocola rhizosphaerae TaxID=1872709 RepID=UPI000E3C840E|nr:sugar ABC transporter substrate-binding protein [Allorhizocola rhizosphaerae]